MAKAKPATGKSRAKPKAIPTDGIDGSATDEPMRTVNQEYRPAADPFVPNEFGVIPPQTSEHSVKDCNDTDCPKCIAIIQAKINQRKQASQPKPVSNANPNDENEKTGNTEDGTQDNAGTTQLDKQDANQNQGGVPLSVADTVIAYTTNGVQNGPIAHAKAGETQGMCWERLRREGRSAGMPKGQGSGTAYEWATRETNRLFPAVEHPEPVIIDESPPEPEPEIAETPEKTEIPAEESSPIGDKPEVVDDGVPGLGEMPESWGTLPANAQLQTEIAWVTANRLKVRSGAGVDLSRALSPAPSYAALSWLETSILFPSKFADISVKATSQQDDEREHVRREKLAIEEIRGLLQEMLEG